MAEIHVEKKSGPGAWVWVLVALIVLAASLPWSRAPGLPPAFAVGPVRTTYQDAAFAFLQVAEIAVRALSSGVNDPFTAMMCIDRIGSAMVQLGGRSLPDPVRRDKSGTVRMVAYPYSYDDLVAAGYRHIREAGSRSPAVTEHLRQQLQYIVGLPQDPRFQSAIRRELSALI